MRRRTTETSSDVDLVTAARDGDNDAMAELWRRHSGAGMAMAGSITNRYEPEDLVSEAFMRIFALIRRGKGPEAAFRSYLYRSIRNVSIEWSRKIAPLPLDTMEEFADVTFSEESTLAALDRSLTVTAFRTLPARWQEALWYTEIEQLAPREIAPILGMSAAGVSALTYRAREGLRQAWIQAHIASVQDDTEHAWALSQLGANQRGKLKGQHLERLTEHLAECARCSTAAEEARHVGSRLTLVLLPLSAGIAGGVGYTGWLQVNGPAAPATAAVLPAQLLQPGAVSTGSPGGNAGGGTAATHGTLGTTAAVGAGVGLSGIAAIAVVSALVVLGGVERGTVGAESAAASTHVAGPTESDPTSDSPAVEVPATAGPAGGETKTTPGGDERAADRTTENPGRPEEPATAPAESEAATTPASPVEQPVGTPVIRSVDTGPDGRYYPILAGTAAPHAEITLLNSDGTMVGLATADDNGEWVSDPLMTLLPGSHEITATQRTGAGAATSGATVVVVADGPTVRSDAPYGDGGLAIGIDPSAAPAEVLADGVVLSCRSDSVDGLTVLSCDIPTAGYRSILVRFGDGARHGAAASVYVSPTAS